MEAYRGAASCKWAVSTFDLPTPDWADAADRPWSCVRDGVPRELESTDECHACVRWESRGAPFEVDERCEHLGAGPFFLDIFDPAEK